MGTAALEWVGMVRADGAPIAGLVPVRDHESGGHRLSVDERAVVIDAEFLERVDFVFFRRFSDGRSSHVAAYVIDNSDERLNEEALAKLHLKVWLQGKAPLLYVAWPSRIDVLSCARGADFWDDGRCRYEPAERLVSTAATISEELRRFSAFRLADGTFWDAPENGGLANYAKAAHQSLIQAIVEADSELDGAHNPIVRRLLLLMVLVKYLEDRRVFPDQGWFGRWHKGARSFFDVLQGGQPDEVKRLLAFLEDKFNGDVFKLPNEGRGRLTKGILARFAELVEGKTLKSQRYLWEQYSFEHLPVEVISYLYQRFVEGGHGTVYTPPFLASLVLDQAMPYDRLTGEERILDPACGSGVFLVGAFRRLVNLWRSKNDWHKPGVATLKEILARSIHGIELDPFAVHLTAFSLSLAVCDALQPDVIWRELTFDRLSDSNLLEADFFRVIQDSRQSETAFVSEGFDVIVGNPPFESKFTKAGIEVDKAAQTSDSSRGKLPDKQSAYLFLEQALTSLRPGGRVCLIQPAGVLYNRKTKAFRDGILRKCQVETILDFTSIRNLYEADPKTVAVLAQAKEPAPDHVIAHWTFRRTASVKERICFELDHYDRHRIPQKLAESDPYVWRANFLGGGRLLQISQRLRGMRTLAEYIKQQRTWDYGEGFIAARTGPRAPAPFLTGKPLLPTEAFTNAGIDESRIGTVKETLFRSAYTEDRFSPPLLLIKETETLPMAYWERGPLAYRHEIVGIHAPQQDSADLAELHGRLSAHRRVLRLSCLLHGGRALVGRATAILKRDIDLLPYPKNKEDLELAFWEDALCQDTVERMSEYVRLGQASALLTKAAGKGDLQVYSTLFVRMLGSVYDNLQADEPIFLDGLTCQPFHFGERPDLSWLSVGAKDELRKLIYDDDRHASLRTIRVLRFYSENVLLLVKPDRLRYWIRSTAIRDADDTLIDLRRQGY